MAIRILHVAQAAGGVDRYIRMLLKYLDKDKLGVHPYIKEVDKIEAMDIDYPEDFEICNAIYKEILKNECSNN